MCGNRVTAIACQAIASRRHLRRTCKYYQYPWPIVAAHSASLHFTLLSLQAALGGAAKTKRPTSVVLVDIDSLKSGKATELLAEVKAMAPVFK